MRRTFLADGASLVPGNVVRAEVLASWERSRRHRVDPDKITARFTGHDHGSPVLPVICHESDETPFQLAAARMLAQRIAGRMAEGSRHWSRAILEHFERCCGQQTEWVLATDGDWGMTNTGARQLDVADLRALTDLALASLALKDFGLNRLSFGARRRRAIASVAEMPGAKCP